MKVTDASGNILRVGKKRRVAAVRIAMVCAVRHARGFLHGQRVHQAVAATGQPKTAAR